LSVILPFEALKLAAALMFAAPALPLLFMGEEYGETAPFQFFTSFLDRDLAAAVRQGRTAEFSRFGWQGAVPDPGDPATFVRSRLNHSLVTAPRRRALREYYRTWLALRRSHPALGAANKQLVQAGLEPDNTVLSLTRSTPSGQTVYLAANLTAERQPWASEPSWRLLLDSADPRFGGASPQGRALAHLGAFQVLLYELAR
ncbi:MAG: DUF3459 domain-containing protein, partial [Candidatus Rokuibacteriota bacterium]